MKRRGSVAPLTSKEVKSIEVLKESIGEIIDSVILIEGHSEFFITTKEVQSVSHNMNFVNGINKSVGWEAYSGHEEVGKCYLTMKSEVSGRELYLYKIGFPYDGLNHKFEDMGDEQWGRIIELIQLSKLVE